MLNFPPLSSMLIGRYSLAFLLFWMAMALACLLLRAMEARVGHRSAKVETVLFWVFGCLMVAFAALRPIGIARDDLGYLEIYQAICPTLTCGQWIQGVRDWGWYSLVGLMKSVIPSPRVMLFIGAAGLLVKLAVMSSLARRPLPVLLLYTGLFYQVQDLTAWRVSLAIAVFLLAIWLIVQLRHLWLGLVLLVCGLVHKQAFVGPLILVGLFLKQRPLLAITLCLVPITLMLMNIYPHEALMFQDIGGEFKQLAVHQGLDSYIAAQQAGHYAGWRRAPIVFYPLIVLIAWLLIKATPNDDRLNALLTGCLVMACLFLWGFASLPDAQVRFFEFFMVPTLLLAGNRPLNRLEWLGVIGVSAMFVAKYNVVHRLLMQV